MMEVVLRFVGSMGSIGGWIDLRVDVCNCWDDLYLCARLACLF
jgi:hypothetical protein